MAKLSQFLRSLEGGQVMFFCQGCHTHHAIRVDPAFGSAWGYNCNPDAPTFTPSILVQGTQPITNDEHGRIMAGEKIQPRPMVCHSFVTDGQIQFLSDCTHPFAGQTLPMAQLPA